MIPRATVRLQLTRDFGFDAARALVDYYAGLGVSHYYLSPVFRARAGSSHGYDTVDFARVSDELGGAAALRRLVRALRRRSMGIVIDIVPNHMGVGGCDNAWWNDVLARGRDSARANFFDIDWRAPDDELRGRVLLPVLDKPLADAVAACELRVVHDARLGGLCLARGESRWPLAPEAFDELPATTTAYDCGDAAGRASMLRLLERQHYVLDDWRNAAARINWRRFFDIGELAALRVEDDAVFAAVHKSTLLLYQDGTIDGVRVDHVDGLAEPLDYCRRLRAALAARARRRPDGLRGGRAWIVVEKVFAAHEPQRDWGVAGTTGYDFMDQASALLHNPAGQHELDVLWRDTAGHPWAYRNAVAGARREVLDNAFAADRERVVRAFFALDAAAAGVGYVSLRRALTELLVVFPVYRCYGMPGALPPEDAAILADALERANRQLDPADNDALDFLGRCLRDAPPDGPGPAQAEAAIRFQQLTTGVAARAIEDTVFYREARLLSRNEVGSDPDVFSIGPDEFHGACAVRAQRFPHGLLATATHDAKRGEDARARLAVLSDAAEAWRAAVAQWSAMNEPLRAEERAPDALDELILYQSLVGAWPLTPLRDADARAQFRTRIEQWWRKALREAKRHTSWIDPQPRYEDACLRFLWRALDPGNAFVASVSAFVDTIAAAGAINGLTQTFLRLTTPGVPDLYQGCEFWDFSLVDPDNRRAVAYAPRINALGAEPTLETALPDWRSGEVKQQLIARVLHHRRALPELYASAGYSPLALCGERAAHAIAFERRGPGGRLIAVATRWPLSLSGGTLTEPRVAPECWHDTWIELPGAAVYEDILHDDAGIELHGCVRVAGLLRRFPVALYFAAE